jgi:hypothetical protein
LGIAGLGIGGSVIDGGFNAIVAILIGHMFAHGSEILERLTIW